MVCEVFKVGLFLPLLCEVREEIEFLLPLEIENVVSIFYPFHHLPTFNSLKYILEMFFFNYKPQ